MEVKMDISRNIGIISESQQEKIKKGKVLICGVGGMGGVCAESLVRMGVEELILIDPDIYEESNLNRQIYSNATNIGCYKVNVLKSEFEKINPNIKIQVFNVSVIEVDLESIIKDVDVVVNGMDELKASLFLERTARACSKKIVDVWLTPYVSVFVITPGDPHWETFLDMKTLDKKIEDINEEDLILSLKKEVEYTLSHFNPFEIISQQLVEDVLLKKRKRPSFAPVVWLSGILMSNEVFKILVGLPHVDYKGIFFNQYQYEIIPGKCK